MEDIWFYIKLGFGHVLDLEAHDHILFLAALTLPFTFKSWKQVVVLATIFTVSHCTSLALSAYGIINVDVGLIEFLIPVTIALTALFNIYKVVAQDGNRAIFFTGLATMFFGLIHGFGFSNYFNMLMAGEEQKLPPLFGFATGIEFSQIAIILVVLLLGLMAQNVLGLKGKYFVLGASIVIVLVTMPMLMDTFPF